VRHLVAHLRPDSYCERVLSNFAVVYWNGHQVVYCFLREDGGEIDEEFDLDGYVWEVWQEQFSAWAADPVFSVRPEVREWLKDAPPHEAG
jgi:hypothetical protein